MTTEIERKYLVRTVPADLERVPRTAIMQGYLAVTPEQIVVRLRAKDAAWFLTVKQGQGLERTEVEVPITQAQFEALWPFTRGRRIEKTRYHVPLEEGLIELDVYHGDLEGLCTAEVEFATLEAARQFDAPIWFGRDVTEDAAYQNASLALHGRPPGGDLVT